MSNKAFTPLDAVTAANLSTEEAAHHLVRSTQTLRVWASKDCGPIKPVRIGNRLGWPTDEVRKLAKGGAQ